MVGAALWSDWDRLRKGVREGLACLQRFDDEEDAFEEEIKGAANEFRQARDLIAAE